MDHLVQVNDYLNAKGVPKLILAALVATQHGELMGAQPPNILWLSDPTRTIHRALGLGKTHWGVFFQPKVLWGYIQAMFRGVLPKKSAKGEDLLQLGGDFLWDRDGKLVWSYLSKNPTDRPDSDRINRAIEEFVGKK